MIEVNAYLWWSVCAFALLCSLSFTLILGLWISRGKIIDRQNEFLREQERELVELRGIRELRRRSMPHVHRIDPDLVRRTKR